ncbi:hypothetical protein I552_0258 [Mycobacterium xenopi 3993]|nr:hypothetical protein I552_0258 [Mycobacterium xenopi 3993]
MGATQLSFAELDPAAEVPLRETTFVVVDLETTGDVRPVPRRQRPTRSPRSER